MPKMKIHDRTRCTDLIDAIEVALYHLEVKNDPVTAAQCLNEARDRSLRNYLAAHGPVYDGTQTLGI